MTLRQALVRVSAVVALLGLSTLGVAQWFRGAAAASPLLLRAVSVGLYPMAVTVSVGTQRTFIVHQNGTVDALDTATGAPLGIVATVDQYGYSPYDIAVAPRTSRVFVASAGTNDNKATVSMLDARTGHLLHVASVGTPPYGLAVDDRAGVVYVATERGVALLDARTGRLRGMIVPALSVSAVALDARSGHLFVAAVGVDRRGLPLGGGAGTVAMIDTRTARVLGVVRVGQEPYPLVIDARRGRVVVASHIDRTVSVLDARTGRVARTVALGGPAMTPDALAVDDATGQAIVVSSGLGSGSENGHVTVLDPGMGRVVSTTSVGGHPWAVAVDERHGRAYLPGTTSTSIVATQSGAVAGVLDISAGLVAVDARLGRVIVVSTAGAPLPDKWDWVRRLPGLSGLPIAPPVRSRTPIVRVFATTR